MAPKITLYGYRRVPFTEKCRRALLLKRLDFELREPSGPEEIRRWSPETGLLPVMTIDDELVSDSTKILLRLEEIRSEPPLLSPDPTIAAQQRHLEDWADESFLWYYQEWLRVADADPVRPPLTGWPRPLRRLGSWLSAGRNQEPPQTELLHGLEGRLSDLVNFLGTRRFFHSDQVSMADLTVYGMLFALSRDAIPGSARLISMRPTLLEFMRAVEEETG